MVDGLLVKTGAADKFFLRQCEHFLGRVASYLHQGVDYALVYLVVEFFEVDVKEGLEYLDNLVDGLLLEVGTADKLVLGQCQHALGRVATYLDELVDYPVVDLALQTLQVDVVEVFVGVAVDFNLITAQFAGQLDVVSALADSQRHLVGLQC